MAGVYDRQPYRRLSRHVASLTSRNPIGLHGLLHGSFVLLVFGIFPYLHERYGYLTESKTNVVKHLIHSFQRKTFEDSPLNYQKH
jgi:hypothetical protein